MGNYINPRDKTLKHLDRLVGWQAGDKPAPVTLEWDLTNRCYLGCTGCHFAHTHTRGPLVQTDRRLPVAHDPGGDVADLSLVQRVLGEVAEAGVQGVVWTGGGEPTVHPHWLPIMRRAASLGLEQGLYTAGGLMTEAQAQDAKRLLSWVVVSLDHADADTYARDKRTVPENFEKACATIRALSGGLATIGVSFLLHSGNYTQALTRMLPLARSLGATYTTFRPLVETQPDAPGVLLGERTWVSQASLLWPALQAEPDVEVDPIRFHQWATWQGHGYPQCHGPRLNATITPDGRVWVCPNRREYQGSCLGDLRTESFMSLWSRHPGHVTVDRDCRAMCRLHTVNETLHQIATTTRHDAFI